MAMADNIWAVPLALSNFNIVVAVLGGFISLFGLVSYLLKENYYLSEARKSFSLFPVGFVFASCKGETCGSNLAEKAHVSPPSRVKRFCLAGTRPCFAAKKNSRRLV